jgi:hypothetical protein
MLCDEHFVYSRQNYGNRVAKEAYGISEHCSEILSLLAETLKRTPAD